MPVTTDILATYRGPGRVINRLLEMGQREDRALAILMAGCSIVFVAQMPRLAREAHLTGQELNMLLGGALLGWVIIAPLMFYIIAAVSHIVAQIFGGRGEWYGARLALFWALLAASPLLLLQGLVAGFIGPGTELNIVGGLWVAVFSWFWISGLRQAERSRA
ncbi:YIP1 family protein [Phaeobacter gallaeciensis]|uniref:YIP1 family protein n=2 Tax=Roseobacteraceae TaxID=2854170 RepID=A0A366WZ35_9RHOB|nr:MULTISPECIES: YIP1 family protein [Roseobacteraceae]MBT3140326.1 YIP1 family protein [Falsiruegeria litorea]MBT8171038.1 YIP1 family protein [Falsiruegeria litorea]RBW53422.1 YIP1 family protein [Phaeobacter gallaeciensis]